MFAPCQKNDFTIDPDPILPFFHVVFSYDRISQKDERPPVPCCA